MKTSLPVQRGFLAIVLLILIVVCVVAVVGMGSLVSRNTTSSGTHLGATLALFAAESGLEYERRRWSQNVEWYRSTTDPNPSASIPNSIGSSTFTVYSNLPATLVKSTLSAAGATLNVFTTDRFPTSGILQIGENLTLTGEFIRYTGVSGTTFTGVTRGQTVGTVTGTTGAHSRNTAVYPVTTLADATLTASCVTPTSFTIVANSKLLSAGTLDVEGEEISYTSSSTTGGVTTLSGVERCRDLATPLLPVAHALGQPVTPVLVGGDSASNQVELFSTGIQGSNNRYARRTIQR